MEDSNRYGGMEPVKLSAGDAFVSAWDKAGTMLFSPFSLYKWLTIAVTAWLACLFENPLPGGMPFNYMPNFDGGDLDLEQIFGKSLETGGAAPDFTPAFEFAKSGLSGILGTVGIALILGLLIFLFLFMLLTLWLKCHGRLLFIGSLANDGKQELVPAFRQNIHLGNSLFIWNILFYLLFLIIGIFLLAPAAYGIYLAFTSGMSLAAKVGIVAVAVIFFIGYFVFNIVFMDMLNTFVALLMFTKRIKFAHALFAFADILFTNIFAFARYYLLYYAAGILVRTIITIIYVFTCCCLCVGGLILSIPFVWALFFLPLLAFFRLCSMTFLAQFGQEFNVFEQSGAQLS